MSALGSDTGRLRKRPDFRTGQPGWRLDSELVPGYVRAFEHAVGWRDRHASPTGLRAVVK